MTLCTHLRIGRTRRSLVNPQLAMTSQCPTHKAKGPFTGD
jgi:hypothetical protein